MQLINPYRRKPRALELQISPSAAPLYAPSAADPLHAASLPDKKELPFDKAALFFI